jgi:hypothetical protein
MESLNFSLLADRRAHVLSPYLIIPAKNFGRVRMERKLWQGENGEIRPSPGHKENVDRNSCLNY